MYKKTFYTKIGSKKRIPHISYFYKVRSHIVSFFTAIAMVLQVHNTLFWSLHEEGSIRKSTGASQ